MEGTVTNERVLKEYCFANCCADKVDVEHFDFTPHGGEITKHIKRCTKCNASKREMPVRYDHCCSCNAEINGTGTDNNPEGMICHNAVYPEPEKVSA